MGLPSVTGIFINFIGGTYIGRLELWLSQQEFIGPPHRAEYYTL